uniref:Hsp21.4 n=1 Tax=Corythucha ciliata TaxID=369451 RepID=A0A1Z1JMX5_CORCT|nr:hsp21.4 [Corythucha ciliata]
MSLLPHLINELLDDYRRPTLGDLYDQNFGLGLLADEPFVPRATLIAAPLRCGYMRPWRSMAAGDSGVSSIETNDKEFKVSLDVQQFKPEELKVKLSDDGYVVVEGKHEERSDEHGFISRQFTRRYKLPENVMPDSLKSSLSSDGVLSLKADKKAIKGPEAKEIKITQTNQPAVKAADKKGAGEKMEE